MGLACRLHGRTLACVSAHFAAHQQQEGKQRRGAAGECVRDVARSLRALRLGAECEEVDLPFAVHHLILLGG